MITKVYYAIYVSYFDGILYRLLIVLPHQLFDWLSRHHLIPAHAVDPQRVAEYWVHLRTMAVPNEIHVTRAPYTTLGLGIWSQVFGIRAVFDHLCSWICTG